MPSARKAAVVAGALALVLIAAHLALNSSWAENRIRARADAMLQRHLHATLGPHFTVGWFGEVRLGPLEVASDSGAPLVDVEQVRIRPSLLAMLIGKVEPAHVTLSGVVVHTDPRGAGLRDLLRRGARPKSTSAASHGSHMPALSLEDARIHISRSNDPPLEIGPFDATFFTRSEGAARTVDARLSVLRGSARVHAELADGAMKLSATADDLPIAHLLPFGDDVPVAVGSGLLTGTLDLDAPKSAPAVAHIDVSVRELVVAGARIADEPVGPMQARYRGTIALDREALSASTTDSSLFLGPNALEIPFDGSFVLRGEPTFDIDVRLGPVNVQQLADALPAQLAPPKSESREPAGEDHAAGRVLLAPPHFDGPIRAEIRASGPVRRPDDWMVAVRLDTKGLRANAREAPFALRGPFIYKPRDAAGVERTIEVGPRSPSYVPLDALPHIVPAAVITSEDGNFYEHDGFDFDEIRDSIANAAEGQRLRGGSTITQQLVKNLYLSRERTLARKIREALITLQIEAALPKARILEIYLNIIEWGPDIYGIGEAARHYFGVDARHLTPKQAVFLATIIPNPVRYSVYFRKGATSRNWDEHMAHLIEKLHERGDLDDAEYESTLADPVVFRTRQTASARR